MHRAKQTIKSQCTSEIRIIWLHTGFWFCASLSATCWVRSSIDMPAIVPRSLLICCRTRVNWSLMQTKTEINYKKQSTNCVKGRQKNLLKLHWLLKMYLEGNKLIKKLCDFSTLCIVGNVSPVSPAACPVFLLAQDWREGVGGRSYEQTWMAWMFGEGALQLGVENWLRDYLAIQQRHLLRQLERLHVSVVGSVGLVWQAHGMRFEAGRSFAWVFEGQVHELSWGHKCLGRVQIVDLSWWVGMVWFEEMGQKVVVWPFGVVWLRSGVVGELQEEKLW